MVKYVSAYQVTLKKKKKKKKETVKDIFDDVYATFFSGYPQHMSLQKVHWL